MTEHPDLHPNLAPPRGVRGLIFTAHSGLSSRAISVYTVHQNHCRTIRHARQRTDWDSIQAPLHIKVAVGTVKPCQTCRPDMTALAQSGKPSSSPTPNLSQCDTMGT
jgi:hypothetical protein